MKEKTTIDLSDIPEITDFSKAHKNPYYERIMEHGFSITEYYSPEDVKDIVNGICTKKIDLFALDAEEQKALERYKKAHGYAK
ncbi:MAG: hypothetical protein FWF81_12260 [Defluviitaleaceae bacterium]|nr:hypothetical protein [Defluviitaleaceae bacterium]